MQQSDLTQLLYRLAQLPAQEQTAVKSKLEWWLQELQGRQVVPPGQSMLYQQVEPSFQPLQTAPSQTTPTPQRHCPNCGWRL